MFFDTEAKLKSPTLSVADRVRILSCDRNTTSPPTSCTVSPLTQPTPVVIGCIAKSAKLEPTSFKILFAQNMIN